MLHDNSFLGEEIRGNIMSNKEPCVQVCVLGRKRRSEVNVTENLMNFLKIKKKKQELHIQTFYYYFIT